MTPKPPAFEINCGVGAYMLFAPAVTSLLDNAHVELISATRYKK